MMIEVTDASPLAFVPNNMVEQQLVAAANGDLDQQKAFERFILDETLYVATPEVPAEETVTFSQGESIRLLNVPMDDGRQAAAVFTSPQRVAEAFGEVGYIGIEGRILFEMIRATPAVLNPGQAYGVVWEPESLHAMIGLPIQRVVEKETEVMLGSPSEVPTELLDRLKTAFEPLVEVQAAWLALAFWPEASNHAWYLEVRSDGDHEPIRRALAAALAEVRLGDKPLDMIINAPGPKEGAGLVVVAPRMPAPTKAKGILGRLFGG